MGMANEVSAQGRLAGISAQKLRLRLKMRQCPQLGVPNCMISSVFCASSLGLGRQALGNGTLCAGTSRRNAERNLQ